MLQDRMDRILVKYMGFPLFKVQQETHRTISEVKHRHTNDHYIYIYIQDIHARIYIFAYQIKLL